MLFLPRYFEGQLMTAYQLIGERFGTGLHRFTAGIFLATRAAAEGVRIFAVSIVITVAFGTGTIPSIIILTILTLIYTFEGGFAAVIWTDVIQMILYFVGTILALWTLGAKIPGGWSRHPPHRRRGAQIHRLPLRPLAHPDLHLLGRPDRRLLSDHGQPWH